jgi:tRNA threonylcarbamoyladenosine biosynthesis protein TsaE
MHTITTSSEEETVRSGFEFSRKLVRGDVVALFGDLGSGKTRFAKGISQGLGIKESVTSPTFTIVNEHHGGRFPVYHFDFYRLRSISELNEIGFDEYLFGDGICIIEWADLILERLPQKRYDIVLKQRTNDNDRTIQIEERGHE